MVISIPTKETGYVPIYSSSWYIFTLPIAAANLTPTRSEMALATTYNVTDSVISATGFSTGRATIEAPRWGSTGFPGRLSGAKTVAETSMEFWADRLGADVRAVLTDGLAVDIMYLPAGDIPAAKAEVWRVKVTSRSLSKDATSQAKVMIPFEIQFANELVTVPA